MSESFNENFMKRAIELAERGRGFTDPNPVVGAVIVKDGEVIGEGWHERYGELHAERNAIADCIKRGNDPKGSDIYVTLEPCCHHGKTPPCTEAIIENEIARVIIGSDDPNPKVAEKSTKILAAAGVKQIRGVLKEECDALNEMFFYYISTGLPYVTLKYAMTADGKIASASGKSKWITGEESRKQVHLLRHRHKGIMAGIGTVLADDPMLDCRLENAGYQGSSNPVRIIVDSNLRIPEGSKIVETAKDIRTIIAALPHEGNNIFEEKKTLLEDAGCEVLLIPAGETGSVDMARLMTCLGEMKISSILLEGGGTLAHSALAAGSVNKICAFIAPKILGGAGAKTPVEGSGFEDPNTCPHMSLTATERFGDDILLEYQVKGNTCLQE